MALFHRHGIAQAVGLELAPTAVQAARRYLAGELAEAAAVWGGGRAAAEGAAAGELAEVGKTRGTEARGVGGIGEKTSSTSNATSREQEGGRARAGQSGSCSGTGATADVDQVSGARVKATPVKLVHPYARQHLQQEASLLPLRRRAEY